MKTAANTHTWFSTFAKQTARTAGRPVTFGLAAATILVWAITGPMFGYSDTWQLVINTGTTIVTFLMVFLIQNTQNRDSEAMQVKLDELIRAIEGAHNALLDLEELEEDDLDKIREKYTRLAKEARDTLDEVEEEVKEVKEVEKEAAAGSRRKKARSPRAAGRKA